MNTQLQHYPGLPPLRLASRAKQEYAGACPFCGGTHRSDRFRVWPEQNRYWCRQCNAHGWLDTFNKDRKPAIQPIPTRKTAPTQAAPKPNPAHKTFYRQLYGEVALWAHANLFDECNPEPYTYLRTRGLSDATIGATLLGYTLHDPEALPAYLHNQCPELIRYAEAAGVLTMRNGTLQTHPNLRGTLVLPYIAGREIVDLRTRSFPGKGYRSLTGSYTERGADRPFGWDVTEKCQTIILTEGEFKALAVTQAYQAGHLSAPAIAQPGLSYLHADWPHLLKERGVETVILAYDSQPRPNKEGMPQLSPEEVWSIRHGYTLSDAGLRVRVLRLPLADQADKADLDAFLLTHSSNVLDALITIAPSLQEYHASLPRTLLKNAKLPLANSYPIHQTKPHRLANTPAHAIGQQDSHTSISMARAEIPQIVEQHITHGEGFLCLAHQPGVGKGHGTTEGLRTWQANAPSTERIGWTALRKNQHQDQEGLNLLALHGRNELNCPLYRKAHILQSKGYPVQQALCKQRCPHLSTCEYLSQFKTNRDKFAAQPLLLSTTWWKHNAIMVLDEFDVTQLTHTVELDLFDLREMREHGTNDLHARTILTWLETIMFEHGETTLSGISLLHALKAHAPNQNIHTTLSAAEQALPSEEEHAKLRGLPKDAGIHEFEQLPPGYLPTIVRQLAREMRMMFSGQLFTSRIQVKNHKLSLFLRHEHLITQLARPEQPKCVLDATITPSLYQAIFPDTPITVIQPDIPIPCTVRQVIRSNWAKSTLHGDRLTDWYETISAQIREDRPTLVVCTQEHEADLSHELTKRGHHNCIVQHYRALRGSNAYRGYDVILTQIYNPNMEAIINQGRSLFADDATPLDERMTLIDRTLQARDGTCWNVQVPTFADSRLAALLEHHREAEMVQCALRGRPFDHPESQITLLFNLPLPGLPPTTIISGKVKPNSNAGRQAASLDKLVLSGKNLLAAGQTCLNADSLAHAAEISVVTVRKHWNALAQALGMITSTETIQPPKGRSYRRMVLVIPEAAPSASECEKSIDHAHNKDSIMCVIYAPDPDHADEPIDEPDSLPLPDRIDIPDGEPTLHCTLVADYKPRRLLAPLVRSLRQAQGANRSHHPLPEPVEGSTCDACSHIVCRILHPQCGQPPLDTHRYGRNATESPERSEILHMFGSQPRPP